MNQTASAGVRRYLRFERPRAKFVAVGDVVETGDPALGGFRYVTEYLYLRSKTFIIPPGVSL